MAPLTESQQLDTRVAAKNNPDPEPSDYEAYTYDRGTKYERSRFTFDGTKWEGLAHERLSIDAWHYVYGNAGTRETYDKNLAAFKKWSIVPKRLVDMKGRMPDLSVTVFGQRIPFPIALGPVGVQTIFHPEGERASCVAAAKEHVPYIFSSASSTAPEVVAKLNGPDAVRWYQLYWPGNQFNFITKSLLHRAKAAGYTALFVTIDTYTLGWRPGDLDNGYNPFMRADHVGIEVGLSDPIFQKHFQDKFGKKIEEDLSAAAAEWMRVEFNLFSHTLEDIKFLQSVWDGPIIIKGIQSVADAKRCVEAGVQGIVVSNHGGRQQDGGNGSLSVLPSIVAAVGDKLEVFFDSGVRCGADIIKALSLGAKMCLVGRPYIYGLAMGGEEGVLHVIKTLLGDLEITAHMAGLTSIKDMNREVVKLESDFFTG